MKFKEYLNEGSGKDWARKNYKNWDISRTDPRHVDSPSHLAIRAQRMGEMAAKKIEQLYGIVRSKAGIKKKTKRFLTKKDVASEMFWQEVRDEASKIWDEEMDRLEKEREEIEKRRKEINNTAFGKKLAQRRKKGIK